MQIHHDGDEIRIEGETYFRHMDDVTAPEAEEKKKTLTRAGFEVKIIKRGDKLSIYRRLQPKPLPEADALDFFSAFAAEVSLRHGGAPTYTGKLVNDPEA